MSDAFDVIVVGGGPAGLFASYYLAEHSGLKVCLIERGQSVRKRGCPIAKTQKCMKCEPCHILSGMGGGGLFSDGKLNFIHKLGKPQAMSAQPPLPSLCRAWKPSFLTMDTDGYNSCRARH